MICEENNYLVHHGIKGQKWGVRRFQNEDGSLTAEGKERYRKYYDMMEKDADEEIKGAQGQIADIEKNGFYAKSAFTSGFRKDLKREGILDDPELSESYLNMFKDVFKQDLKDAQLKKKAAQEARSFIENSKDISFDDIVTQSSKIDKKNKSSILKDESEKFGKEELGLERKHYQMHSKMNDRDIKRLAKEYTPNQMQVTVKQFVADARKEANFDMNKMKLTKDNKKTMTFAELPLEEQFAIVVGIMNGEFETI